MDHSLETLDDKLLHLKNHLWELSQEQHEKRNYALHYVLQHLMMIADNARMQIELCPVCNGIGEVDDTLRSVRAGIDINKTCPKCNGSGVETKSPVVHNSVSEGNEVVE